MVDPNDEDWNLVPRPKRHLLDVNLRKIREYRNLLKMFASRDIVTVFLTTLVFVVVFGNIAGISTDGLPNVLFYLSGIVLGNYFADSLNPTAHLIEIFKHGILAAGGASSAGLLHATTFTATTFTAITRSRRSHVHGDHTFTAITLVIGVLIFNRTEQTFMDTV